MESDGGFKLLHPAHQQAILDVVDGYELRDCTIQVCDKHEKGNNFMGKIIKIIITGTNKDDKKMNKHLVMKMASTVKNIRNIIPLSVMYALEITYYTKILPVLKNLQYKYIQDGGKFNFVNCYKVHSVEFEEFLILDDVTAEGYVLEPRKEPLSLQHLELAIKNIAYYHSLSFALRKHSPELFKEFVTLLQVYSTSYIGKIDRYVEMTISQAIMYTNNKQFKQILNDFQKVASSKIKSCFSSNLCEPYNVLSHGDCWQNNIMFKCEDEKPTDAIFLDWQMGKFCSPHIDLLHLLFSASDAKLRKTHYHHLIDLYYNILKAQLTKLECDAEEIYPEHIYKEHIKLLAPHALTFSIISANLLIREGEDIPDMDELLKDGVPNEEAMNYSNKNSIADFVIRIDNLIVDFLELGFIDDKFYCI